MNSSWNYLNSSSRVCCEYDIIIILTMTGDLLDIIHLTSSFLQLLVFLGWYSLFFFYSSSLSCFHGFLLLGFLLHLNVINVNNSFSRVSSSS